jgi:hypothetical protein
MQSWANEFLDRMYRRIGEVSSTSPITDLTKLDQ